MTLDSGRTGSVDGPQSGGNSQDEEELMETTMKGKWTQMQGAVKSKWGKLTDDDMKQIDGEKDKLVGKLQEKYDYSREEAERHVNEFVRAV